MFSFSFSFPFPLKFLEPNIVLVSQNQQFANFGAGFQTLGCDDAYIVKNNIELLSTDMVLIDEEVSFPLDSQYMFGEFHNTLKEHIVAAVYRASSKDCAARVSTGVGKSIDWVRRKFGKCVATDMMRVKGKEREKDEERRGMESEKEEERENSSQYFSGFHTTIGIRAIALIIADKRLREGISLSLYSPGSRRVSAGGDDSLLDSSVSAVSIWGRILCPKFPTPKWFGCHVAYKTNI
ncbi:hypothetical protein DM860_011582 [Cuscuta australis]|uniref:Uncharacterized protein n=1 Tax=Cuscuta australis TaxID=267555 RepID=A0A328D0W1_9ASTE|nr:hypothetical protein DM860_011582 [Cuscuta australis]